MTPPSRRSNLVSMLLGALSVAIVVGVLALTGTFDGADADRGAATAATATATAAPPAASGGAPTSVADIYAKVAPAVVFVQARSDASATGTAPRSPVDPSPAPDRRGTASGSGFVVDAKGTIVTNQHVVDGSRDVTVRFGEDGDPIPARLVGEDPSTDIAVLKIDPKKVEGGLKVLELADSAKLRPGEATIAIGAPFGLAGSVTTGVVSALNRDIESPNGFPISGVVQTDAAINPGNSGGPLLDAQGRAIGVNSQIATNGNNANSGVGFAVPIDTVKEVVPLLERDGEIDRPYVGLSTSDGEGGRKGAIVRAVVPGAPGAEAGLRPGDRIVSVAGKAVEDAGGVAEAIADRKPGQAVEVRYVRGSEERTATVKLGTRPDQPARTSGP
jgi:S1-C subfamily serine protease